MAVSRRRFLGRMAVASGALSLGAVPRAYDLWSDDGEQEPAPRSLRILILGGTNYIGPYQIRHALARGHRVSIFNRGRTQPTLFPELFDRVEKLVGDRNDDLESLRGREWDAVIDNSAHAPAWVRSTGELLKGSVGRYLFASSLSVYAKRSVVDQDESGLVGSAPAGSDQLGFDAENSYGVLKAQCEEVGVELFGDRFTAARPGAIVGPGDPFDFFTSWLIRADRGGEMLVPAPPENPVQFIDVRDTTEFMIHLLERDLGGPYNITGPAEPLHWGRLIDTMREVSDSGMRMTWVTTDFLREQGVEMFTDLPLWMLHEGEALGFHRISIAKAASAGLTHRPLRVTVADLLAWCREQPAERWENLTGLSAERERELLEAWHRRAA